MIDDSPWEHYEHDVDVMIKECGDAFSWFASRVIRAANKRARGNEKHLARLVIHLYLRAAAHYVALSWMTGAKLDGEPISEDMLEQTIDCVRKTADSLYKEHLDEQGDDGES